MNIVKLPILAVVISVLALGACNQSGANDGATNTPETNTQQKISGGQEKSATPSQTNQEKPRGPFDWQMIPEESEIRFSGVQTGKEFSGTFEKFQADITLNPDNLDTASIFVSVQTGSAKTGDRQRDDAMPGTDWFDIENYPTAEFLSSSVVSVGEGRYEAFGKLTIKGVSKDIVLPFSLSIVDNKANAEGAIELVRSGYNVGQGQWNTGEWVALEVDVSFKVTATR